MFPRLGARKKMINNDNVMTFLSKNCDVLQVFMFHQIGKELNYGCYCQTALLPKNRKIFKESEEGLALNI